MAQSSIFISVGSNVLPITVNNTLRITYSNNGGNPYYIFEKVDLATAPVVVFLHGYTSTPPDPSAYGGWIEDLLLHGNTVIYPLYYQAGNINTSQYTPNAEAAIQTAYAQLAQPGHTASDGTIAVIGHSIGCVVGANFANDAVSLGLPNPKSILLANTADTNAIVGSFTPIQYSSYSGISSSAQVMFIIGNNDTVAGTTTSIEIYNKLTQLSTKWLTTLYSASHLSETLTANHFSSLSVTSDNNMTQPPVFDQLDSGGYWFLFSNLQAAVLSNLTLNPGTEFSLGTWSDTTDITPHATVVTGPSL